MRLTVPAGCQFWKSCPCLGNNSQRFTRARSAILRETALYLHVHEIHIVAIVRCVIYLHLGWVVLWLCLVSLHINWIQYTSSWFYIFINYYITYTFSKLSVIFLSLLSSKIDPTGVTLITYLVFCCHSWASELLS